MKLMHGGVAQVSFLFDHREGLLKNRNSDALQSHVPYQRFHMLQALSVELDRCLARCASSISRLRPELRHLAECGLALTELKSLIVLPPKLVTNPPSFDLRSVDDSRDAIRLSRDGINAEAQTHAPAITNDIAALVLHGTYTSVSFCHFSFTS